MGSKRLARYSRQEAPLFFRYVTHGIPCFVIYGFIRGTVYLFNGVDVLIVYLLHCSKPMKIFSISICLRKTAALSF
jgi:hypothetical protein